MGSVCATEACGVVLAAGGEEPLLVISVEKMCFSSSQQCSAALQGKLSVKGR